MVSDPLSQLTAVFVPSGNDPPSTHCECMAVHVNSHTIPMLGVLTSFGFCIIINYGLLASIARPCTIVQ